MNKPTWALTLVGILIIAFAVTLFVLPGKTQAPTNTNQQAATTTAQDNRPQIADTILVESIMSGGHISSPLVVTGSARGRWYFEASFGAQLKNASGTTIAQAPATAMSDWMSSDFVPFKAELTFPIQPAGSRGTLILHNDNPSGLPQNDESLSIPVVF